jgi:ketosteroid isomerase-like protein
MTRRELMVTALAVGAAGLRPAAQKTQAGPNSQRVTEAERGFAATMAKRDATAFATFIADEAIFMGAGEAPRVLRGKPAIVAAWKQYFDGPTPPFSWEPEIVEVLDSGSLALTSGPVHDPSGGLIGLFNSIWRLEPDGRWRVLFDRGSQVCPANK